MNIYLDNNATTAPAPQVIEVVNSALTQWWANPSSVHRFGQLARQQVELAREDLANLLSCKPRELTFTSGATEANHLALRGITALHPNKKTIITTAIEHAAISEVCDQLQHQGLDIQHTPLLEGGVVDIDAFAALLQEQHNNIALVTIHWVNNEIGTVQPIAQIAKLCQQYHIPFHTDATQAVGKLPINLAEIPVSALSLSAHKFHGPKGIGALFTKTTQRFQPQQTGGPQERQRRGGTENVPGIVGLGKAAQLAQSFINSNDAERLAQLRNHFETELHNRIPDIVIHAKNAPRIWNTSNIGFPFLQSEAILLLLSEKGLYASAGAACSSGSLEPSPILLAMQIPDVIAHGSVRFSLSRFTTSDDINHALEIIPTVIEKIKKTMM